MIVYFAGVNQTAFCEAFKGKHVLESFADIRPVLDRFRPTFDSMILDSGAYSVASRGASVELGEYTEFCLKRGKAYRWVASLDSIKGGADENIRNWHHLLDSGVKAVPTFHQGEPWHVLQHYLERTDRIAVGLQRPNGRIVPADARAFLEEFFTKVPAGTKVHGWGLTNYTQFPFESVDSTTWFWEMKALMAHSGQAGSVLKCLIPSELIDLVLRKYERQGRRAVWEGFEEEPCTE